jgi:multicomponent Na+:H+ antiporter subunit D
LIDLAPFPVVVPLLGAVLLTVATPLFNRRVFDLLAIAVAVVVSLVCGALLVGAMQEPIVYWFGGWTPSDGIALGIPFVIDPINAALAALSPVLVAASLTYTWRFFDTVRNLWHVLMLVFLAAIVGFCLSGDLFTMFVFFELMSVAAFSLTGFKIEESGSQQGALNFAITNSVGAFLILSGIALLYGRTSALNLAQIGETIADAAPDGLIVVAFVFVVSGYFIKAAVVPFHFWLADAYTAAPTPVCVLFAGVLSELGLYGAARVHWTVFDGALGNHLPELRVALVVAGAVTALVGAVMCWPQRHIKRLLAFATVSHVGLFTIGFSLFSPTALAGTVIYLVSDGLVKASLFLCAGILLHRLASVDELGCDGLARDFPFTRAVFVLGGLALAGLPPFGTFVGKSLIEEEATVLGFPWVTLVFVAASVVTGGAVLRVAGRVFWGFGPGESPERRSEAEGDEIQPETRSGRGRTPAVMWGPAALLMLMSLGVGFVPHLEEHAEVAAERFQDREAYAGMVLEGVAPPELTPPPPPSLAKGALLGLGSTIAAFLAAAAGLFHRRLPPALMRAMGRLCGPPLRGLRALHSGHVGDYVMWLTVGVALFGATMALTLAR